jgi:DNA-binding winged helix-turn-helix (wHTH) protein
MTPRPSLANNRPIEPLPPVDEIADCIVQEFCQTIVSISLEAGRIADAAAQPAHLASMGAIWFNRRSHTLVFGRFRFVTHSRELSVDGAPIAIGNRAREVLFVLTEARGELVTKDELLSRVWPTTIVEENNLQFQVSTLRKALGRDRNFIRTVSGRGYRFVAEITVEGPRSQADPETHAIDQHTANVVKLHSTRSSGKLPARRSEIVRCDAAFLDVAALAVALFLWRASRTRWNDVEFSLAPHR